MNKILSIAWLALILSVFSTPSAADDIKLFGISAEARMTRGTKTLRIIHEPTNILVLGISGKGLTEANASFEHHPDSTSLILGLFRQQPPQMVVERTLTIETREAVSLGGSIVGKNQITLSAESFEFQQLTVFGTNGTITLNFTDPSSLIKSITLDTSNIAITSKGEELHIGSVWGDFTGVPSSNSQLIHILGYSSFKIEFNPAAIAELLSKK